MKITYVNRFQIPLLMVAGLLFIGLVFSSKQGDASGAITPEQCCRCHSDVCEKSSNKRYVHAPVLENHCAVCHVQSSMSTVDRQDVDKEAPEAIEWFAKDCQENNEHWFELPGEQASTSVSLMAKAGGQKVLQQVVDLPALANTEQFPWAQGGAEIYDLRVVEVKKGVFLSARITWKTDRITDAQVFYGENSLSSSTALDGHWSTSHEITVTGLYRGKDYTFVAVSHDIYGAKVISPKMFFSTNKFYREAVLQSKRTPAQVEMQSRFYQDDGRIFAQFVTSQPVAMRLGRTGKQSLMLNTEGADDTITPQEHLQLTDPYSLTITVCVGCHPQAKGTHSHPVDIRPKAGMRIPPEYHTMADGRLSCMSCHQAHASDNEYRLTRSRRKDLCLSCHRNFG